MDETDFDIVCEGLPPETAKRFRKILAQWCIGDENSFPVQQALLTRAQWHAAAKIPVLLNQSLELLGLKLAEYRQQTAALLKEFDDIIDDKTQTLENAIAAHSGSSQQTLANLSSYAREAERAAASIREELKCGAHDLKKMKDDLEAERLRMEKVRRDYESKKDWTDWIIFALLLLAMVAIGIGIGLRWRY